MHEFSYLRKPHRVQLLFQKILYSLHIMVGCLLYLFYPLCVLRLEIHVQIAQLSQPLRADAFELWQWQRTQRQQILNFNHNSVAY